jgi:hypothetical protein
MICRYVEKAMEVIRFIGVMALLLAGLAFLIGIARTPKHKPAPKAERMAHIAAEWQRPPITKIGLGYVVGGASAVPAFWFTAYQPVELPA